MKTLFYIGHTFPEPTTTAAGTRTLQILQVFQQLGYSITFGTTAQKTPYSLDLATLDIHTIPLQLNDTSFDALVLKLKPEVVIYDRFITEEQFGWRVQENSPNTLQILDTQDLHFLRKAREIALKKGESLQLFSETAKREIASILRCDLSLLISEFEIKLLQNTFKIPASILCYLPFLVNNIKQSTIPFEERNHFIFIGNFLHAPNVDCIKWLKNNIWEQIRNKLPEVQLHVYGAYMPQQVTQMHDDATGFLVKGWTPSVFEVMQAAKVCLTPLRFGAGLKGKVVAAMQAGTPVVTTKIGAEGITENSFFKGVVEPTEIAVVEAAIQLYNNPTEWKQAQDAGYTILENRFLKKDFIRLFQSNLQKIQNDITSHRQKNFIGQLLHYHTLKSNKYLSKWIEEKNKHN